MCTIEWYFHPGVVYWKVEVKEEMQYSPFTVVAVPFTQIRLTDAFSFLCYIYPTIPCLSEPAPAKNAMGFNGEKQRIMLINGEGDVIQIVGCRVKSLVNCWCCFQLGQYPGLQSNHRFSPRVMHSSCIMLVRRL
jgi:hypothetical protein